MRKPIVFITILIILATTLSVESATFEITGTVYNESYVPDWLINVSFYSLSYNAGGPPTKTFENSTISSSIIATLGEFSATLDTTKEYSIKAERLTAQNTAFRMAMETEPISGAHLNTSNTNLTLLVQAAATVNITFLNASGGMDSRANGSGVCMKRPNSIDGNAKIDFSDMVYEQFEEKKQSIWLNLPTEMKVGCMFFGGSPGTQTTNGFSPRYVNFTVSSIPGDKTDLEINISESLVNITVNYQVSGNTTPINNITFMDAPLAFPLGGNFLVPDGGSQSKVPYFFPTTMNGTIEVVAPAGGDMTYMIRAVATNDTGPGNSGDDFYVGFQNVTIGSTDTEINLTLYLALGTYATGQTDTNAPKYNINSIDKDGSNVNDMHAEIILDGFNMLLMIMNWNSGNAKFLLPNNTNATLRTFGEGGPKEYILDLIDIEKNITIENDFKRFSEGGSESDLNAAQMDEGIQVSIYRNGTVGGISCDRLPINNTCLMAGPFNPTEMKNSIVQGSINLLINDTISNTQTYFINAETNGDAYPVSTSTSELGTEADSGFTEDHRLFSSAVRTYDEVKIGKLVNDIDNESTINILFNNPTNNDQTILWNNSADSGNQDGINLPSEFTNFPSSFFNRTLGGEICAYTNVSSRCYMESINDSSIMIWLQGDPDDTSEILHFSGFDPIVSGTSATTTTSSSTTSNSGSSSTWRSTNYIFGKTLREGIEEALGEEERVIIRALNEEHSIGVTKITKTTVTIEIASTPQIIKLSIGETKKIDLNTNGYYDLSVTLSEVRSRKAFLKIKEINENYKSEQKIIPEKQKTPLNEKKPEEILPIKVTDKETVATTIQSQISKLHITITLALITILIAIGIKTYRKK